MYESNFGEKPVGISDDPLEVPPGKLTLEQNFPNPFNPTTVIKYTLPSGKASDVTLKIYDVLGREVSTLINKNQQPGEYEVYFNAAQFPSGVYFYNLKADQYLSTKKMILLK